MQLIETKIKDLYIIEPHVFGDERGYFFETYNQQKWSEMGLNYTFVQDNISMSEYGVIRGLHFQTETFAQAKLVQVLQGEVLDVVVDLRLNSPTFGQKMSVVLSSENKKQMLIPRGFAHGFAVLSQQAIFNYKCDNFYNKNHEAGIKINDETLNIDWLIPVKKQIITQRDLNFPSFYDLQNNLK